MKDIRHVRPHPAIPARASVALLLLSLLLPVPAAPADDGNAVAIINGRPLSRKKLVDKLLEARGVEFMQQLIALELAKQESRRRGVEVTDADVEAQFQRALREIAPGTDAEGVELDEAGRQQALQTVLQQRCLTMPEFMIAMERNAHLRKVVEADFRVDEATLREEFARTYGEKVQVRHIQLPLRDTPRQHEVLDKLTGAADFAEVARQYSINEDTARQGGLMEPFSFGDQDIPAALREAAFALRPGEISTMIVTGKMVHILKLERRIAPAGVSFAQERDKVEARLRERVLRQQMEQRIVELFSQAQIRILDRELRRGFEDVMADWSRSPAAP